MSNENSNSIGVGTDITEDNSIRRDNLSAKFAYTPDEYKIPKNHNIRSFNSWDEIFDFHSKKEGGNYTLLKNWLKENFNKPNLK